MPMSTEGLDPESWLVAAGRPSQTGEPLDVPLVPASTFLLGDRLEYSRDDGTPTWEALEEVIGGLEGGRAIAFASGMAAIAAVFDQMPTGARLVIPDECYQGVAGLAEAGQRAGRWSVERVSGDDTARWIAACASGDLVWLESPSNPSLTVSDVSAICAAERKAGAILAVDNTFATPLNQRPLDYGATVSIQSATKFIGDIPTCLPVLPARVTNCCTERCVSAANSQGPRPAHSKASWPCGGRGRWRSDLSARRRMRRASPSV